MSQIFLPLKFERLSKGWYYGEDGLIHVAGEDEPRHSAVSPKPVIGLLIEDQEALRDE